MLLDDYCGSAYWNSSLTWSTPTPTLTNCFKSTLTYLPCLFLWLSAPFQVYSSKSKSSAGPIPFTILNTSKFAITIVLLCTNLTKLAYVLFNEPMLHRLLIHSLFLTSATLSLSLYIDFLSKLSGVRACAVQWVFWGFYWGCEVVVLVDEDGEWSVDYILKSAILCLITVQLFLNCWADAPGMYSMNIEKPSPITSASVPSTLTFFWFEPLARLGHRRPLQVSDLSDLPPENGSKYVNVGFTRYFEESAEQQSRSSPHKKSPSATFQTNGTGTDSSSVDIDYKPELSSDEATPKGTRKSILAVLFSSFGGSFLFGCFLKLVQDLLAFGAPFLLRRLIIHIQSDEPTWKGYFYSSLLLLISMLCTLLQNQYMFRMYVLGLKVRTGVVGCVYRKALRMSGQGREDSTTSTVNLMSVDAQKLTDMVPYLTIIWSAPLQIALSLYFLYELLGPSVFAGLAVMVLLIPVNAVMGIKVKAYQLRQMKSKDTRIKLVGEVLQGIKVLKLHAWTAPFTARITSIRSAELVTLRNSAFISSIAMFVWTCAPMLVAIVTFAFFVLTSDETMDAEKAFVSLSYFNIMRLPLNLLPMMLVSLVQATVSITRLNNYMNQHEITPIVTSSDSQNSISINGEFSHSKNNPPSLQLNITIKKGELVAIVGAVGSGKSSLLKCILSEMELVSGHVKVSGSIAYQSQVAWIQNGSVKDNVLFGNSYERVRYEQVLEACCLGVDLGVWKGGDQTEIGEKGINLSGGQKQRVALARAVYNNADVYLLDDPLSSVDAHVGKALFTSLISSTSGLLSHKTRVLVTHNVAYLPQMDRIIVLENGLVSEIGSYKDLLQKKGAFAEFLLQHVNVEDADAVKDLEAVLGKGEVKREILKKDKDNSPTPNSQTLISQTTQTQKLIEDEAAQSGVVKWSVFFYYLRAIGWRMVLVSLGLQVAFQGFSVGSNIVLAVWAGDNNNNNTTSNHFSPSTYITLYTSLGLGQALSIFLATLVMAVGTLRASSKLHLLILQKVMHAPMGWFDSTPTGRIVNRLGKDVEVLDNAVSMSLTSWLKCSLNVISTFTLITLITPLFITITIPTLILYTLIQRYYISSSRQLRRLESITRSPVYSHFSETLAGVSTIRAFRKQDLFRSKCDAIVDGNQACAMGSLAAARFLAVLLESLGNVVIFSSAIFSVYSSLTPSLLALSLSYALQITHSLNYLVETTNNVEQNLIAVERLKEYNNIVQEADGVLQSDEELLDWPKGRIQFQSYSCMYRPELLVLKDLSFEIKQGEKVGICGRTGAGKSTMGLAILRLIEGSQGKILIDGVDISKVGLDKLRQSVGVIPQDPVIFSGTLRSNLDPFQKHSDEELWTALSLAHLNTCVEDKGGLGLELQEAGENLSLGQRQLLCLARALLQKTRILILDEATAAVDLATDELIQSTVGTVFKDCTVLTIAHRLGTILESDRILVLNAGRVQEFDSPRNLLQNTSSLFYSLARDAGLV